MYGIGASAASLKGYNALRAFKDRPQAQPFTVHLSDPGAAERYVDLSRPVLRRLVMSLRVITIALLALAMARPQKTASRHVPRT